jgi:hypothetical protein
MRLLEPLLSEVLPPKKQTRPPAWTKRELLDGVLYQLKMAVTGKTYPKTCRPYSTVYWHYKQWRAGSIEKLMTLTSWGNPRAGKKRKWTTLMIVDSQAVKILVMRVLNRKAFAYTRQPMGLKAPSRWYAWISILYSLHSSECIWWRWTDRNVHE